LENAKGLDIVSSCIITKGCIGKLYKTKRNRDSIRESFPKFDPRFQNYEQRRSFFNFVQPSPATEWVVPHNLGVSPAISVFEYLVSPTNKVYPSKVSPEDYSVSIVDQNTVSIVLNRQAYGVAHCVARTSVALKPKFISPLFASVQVTTNGTFVFALPKYITKTTFSGSPLPLPMDLANYFDSIQIEVSIQKPNEEALVCFESLPMLQEVTAWAGWDEILIRKRRNYYTRNKNVLKFTTFNDSQLVFDDIPEGTQLRFTRVDYGTGIKTPIAPEGLFILLSKAPYQTSDKTRDQLIDLGELVDMTNGYFTYHNGDFYLDQSLIEKTYPLTELAPH
jgi:hypothetical protein